VDIKPEKFPCVTLIREYVEERGPLEDIDWRSGWSWHLIKERYADSIQRDLFRAILVSGIFIGRWKTVFHNLYHGVDGWGVVNKNWFEKKEVPTWHQLFSLVVTVDNGTIQYPLIDASYWQSLYGYTQVQYLTDLKEYWNDLANEYYQPWYMNRVGYDSVASEAIKQVSQETQVEIEQLIQAAKLLLHLVKNGGLHDNQQQDETEAEPV
jgi:hypothetical protein